MTIRSPQPDKLTVVVKSDTNDLSGTNSNSLENQRKYHNRLYSAQVGWEKCVKSDWLSVVKSCGVCLLLVWVGWLHWSNHQLSVDILVLKNTFSFGSRVIENQPKKELYPQVNSDEFSSEHLEYIHLTKRKRRRRNYERIRDEITAYMREKTYTLFLPGLNQHRTEKDYFKWNLTNAGTETKFIACNSDGTFTFKKRGFYLVASQLTVKGHNDSQNYAISYGYKTVLLKDQHEEVLMLSEITQDNRGICYSNSLICSTDTISHQVIRSFEKEEKIAIKANTNGCTVNYYLTEKNSYIAIVALDLWYPS